MESFIRGLDYFGVGDDDVGGDDEEESPALPPCPPLPALTENLHGPPFVENLGGEDGLPAAEDNAAEDNAAPAMMEVEQQQQQQQEWGYRQWLEEAVRWRQASEPADPVWWVDRMPTQAFKDGWVTWPPHHTTLSHHHTTLPHHHTTLPHHHSASYGVTAWRDLAWRGLACLVVDWLGLA